MTLSPASRILFAATVLLAASACTTGKTSSPTAELASATEAADPTPATNIIAPSPTPQPIVLFIAHEGEDVIEDALASWAEGPGWQVVTSLPDDLPVGGAIPGLRAIVTFRSSLPQARLDELSTRAFALAIEEPGIQVGLRLSTIGENGARHDQAGFLAGVMAGLASEARSVALVVGTDGEHEAVYRNAFVHGLRYGCPRCRLAEVAAVGLGETALRGNGVDALFIVPGADAGSALERAQTGKPWIVWVGRLPAGFPVEQLAGRVAFAPEALLTQVMDNLLDGMEGEAIPYTIENAGLSIKEVNQKALSPGRMRFVETTLALLASGELDVGIDPTTGEER